MRKTYLFLLAAIALSGVSCVFDRELAYSGTDGSQHEIEINIANSSQKATRTPVPDDGFARERDIAELDLLVFSSTDVYQYRREAYRVGATNSYRATMVETTDRLTAYVFANCRDLLVAWEARSDKATTWAGIQEQLRDADPSRLVGTNIETDYTPLPMWGVTSGTVSTTKINKWEAVQLLRSVASVDLYVEKSARSSKLTLTDLHLYYAPDRGYLAPPPAANPDGYELASPADMATTLNTLVASDRRTNIYNINSVQVEKDEIAGQMYFYDNDVSGTVTATRRHTRAIVAGYYDQPDPVYAPEDVAQEYDLREKRYWPLDFVNADGTFRQLWRNWKYVFNVTACNGPGYGSLEEAAENYPVDLEVDIIYWNRDELEIGVEGQYYVSMERKDAWMQRTAGSTDHLRITYNILDEVPGETFTIAFKDDTNGPEVEITDGIENDWFRVTLVHDVSGKRADLYFEALQDYAAAHSTDTLVVTFRSLRFEIAITQLDSADEDWEKGDDIPADL